MSAAGRGKKAQSSDAASQKSSVVITQLPYQTNKAAMVAAIAQLIEKGTLTGQPWAPLWPLAACHILLPCLQPLLFVMSVAPAGRWSWPAAGLRTCETCSCMTAETRLCLGLTGLAWAGISDVQDESDRDGMRVVLDVKRGFNPEVRLCHACQCSTPKHQGQLQA